VFTLQTLAPAPELWEGQVAEASGFSLRAGVAARGGERENLEHLARYVSRPPVATERIALTDGGRIRYALKTPYRDGTTHVIFEPLDFMVHIPVCHAFGAACGCANRLSCRFVIARLAALVPKPRAHLTRYHGVFAPHNKWRAEITPARRGSARSKQRESEKSAVQRQRSMSWAQRLKRVFRVEIDICRRCGGTLKVIASIEEQEVIDRLLEHLDRSTDAPHRAHPTRAPPQEQLPIRAGSGSRRAGRPDGRVGVGGGALRCRHAMVAVACRFRALDQAAECLSPSARTAQSW